MGLGAVHLGICVAPPVVASTSLRQLQGSQVPVTNFAPLVLPHSHPEKANSIPSAPTWTPIVRKLLFGGIFFEGSGPFFCLRLAIQANISGNAKGHGSHMISGR